MAERATKVSSLRTSTTTTTSTTTKSTTIASSLLVPAASAAVANHTPKSATAAAVQNRGRKRRNGELGLTPKAGSKSVSSVFRRLIFHPSYSHHRHSHHQPQRQSPAPSSASPFASQLSPSPSTTSKHACGKQHSSACETTPTSSIRFRRATTSKNDSSMSPPRDPPPLPPKTAPLYPLPFCMLSRQQRPSSTIAVPNAALAATSHLPPPTPFCNVAAACSPPGENSHGRGGETPKSSIRHYHRHPTPHGSSSGVGLLWRRRPFSALFLGHRTVSPRPYTSRGGRDGNSTSTMGGSFVKRLSFATAAAAFALIGSSTATAESVGGGGKNNKNRSRRDEGKRKEVKVVMRPGGGCVGEKASPACCTHQLPTPPPPPPKKSTSQRALAEKNDVEEDKEQPPPAAMAAAMQYQKSGRAKTSPRSLLDRFPTPGKSKKPPAEFKAAVTKQPHSIVSNSSSSAFPTAKPTAAAAAVGGGDNPVCEDIPTKRRRKQSSNLPASLVYEEKIGEWIFPIDKSVVANELESLPYFSKTLSKEDMLGRLRRMPEGSFIVRISGSRQRCLALTMRAYDSHLQTKPPFIPSSSTMSHHQEQFTSRLRAKRRNPSGICHYLIVKNELGYRIKGSKHFFPTLPMLVTHHTVMREQLPCRLLFTDWRQHNKLPVAVEEEEGVDREIVQVDL